MKIATWNVNSIKQRLDHVKKWLGENDIDVLFLQELKSMEFPSDEISAIGDPDKLGTRFVASREVINLASIAKAFGVGIDVTRILQRQCIGP